MPAKFIPIPDLYRGDTFKGIQLNDLTLNGLPFVILEARSQIRTIGGKLLHAFEVDFSGNSVLLKGIPFAATEKFPPGKVKWDLEVTTQEFGRKTILKSLFSILEDVSR